MVFVVDDGKHRLGILTDLGHVFTGLADVIASLDAVLLESNYDPDMLANGSYPSVAQRAHRWPGRAHIQLRGRRASGTARHSGCNGRAWGTFPRTTTRRTGPGNASQDPGDRLPLFVATRYEASGVMEI